MSISQNQKRIAVITLEGTEYYIYKLGHSIDNIRLTTYPFAACHITPSQIEKVERLFKSNGKVQKRNTRIYKSR